MPPTDKAEPVDRHTAFGAVAFGSTSVALSARTFAMRADIASACYPVPALPAAVAPQDERRRGDDAHVLFGTALARVVRSALMRNNLDEIDQYFAALVRNSACNWFY